MRDIDVPGEHRTGDEELRSRNWRAVLDEVILNRQLQLLRQVHRRVAQRDHRAAALDERADLRDGAIRRHATKLRSEFGGNIGWLGPARASAAAAAAPTTANACGNRARRQDQHVVLRVEMTGVELRRKDARERELELLEDPSCPPGLDRAAVLIPQRDARGAQPVHGRRVGNYPRTLVTFEADTQRGELLERRTA